MSASSQQQKPTGVWVHRQIVTQTIDSAVHLCRYQYPSFDDAELTPVIAKSVRDVVAKLPYTDDTIATLTTAMHETKSVPARDTLKIILSHCLEGHEPDGLPIAEKLGPLDDRWQGLIDNMRETAPVVDIVSGADVIRRLHGRYVVPWAFSPTTVM